MDPEMPLDNLLDLLTSENKRATEKKRATPREFTVKRQPNGNGSKVKHNAEATEVEEIGSLQQA